MEQVKRKVRYRIYPSPRQANRMVEVLRLHQRLYNAALEQRIDAYRRCGKSLNYYDQAKELTQLRAEFPEYTALNAQSEQVTLRRLEKAFQAFFRRVKAGDSAPGFPRFKAFDRFKGWGYAAHGDGWKFKPNTDYVNGTLHLSGVGNLQARGRPRFIDQVKSSRSPGQPKTVEIIRKSNKWYASITFATLKPHRASGDSAVGIDWGTTTFVTIVTEDNKQHLIENPRHFKKYDCQLKKAQRNLSRKKKGSKNRAKAKLRLVSCHERLANQRDDFLHQTSARIVRESKLVATEALNIKAMTAHGGAYKSGLNRSVLDTSPGKFFAFLEYKAADAGIPYIEIPTRKVKPSQSCSGCGAVQKKTLGERTHLCACCGLTLDRDVNAARVILNYALTGFVTGREPSPGVEGGVARPLKHETQTIPERSRERA
jgi:putative transposase